MPPPKSSSRSRCVGVDMVISQMYDKRVEATLWGYPFCGIWMVRSKVKPKGPTHHAKPDAYLRTEPNLPWITL